ncbi:hypothetical protein T484DRAFT_1902026, partial [Baffinella frigidus]
MALFANATVMECRNNLDDTFLNRCWLQHPPGAAHVLGDVVQPWINPRSVAVAGTLLILILPAIASSRSIVLPPASYCALKLSALHFVNRAAYALVLDVALYTVFQQRRPCACSTNGGPFLQVGSVYGMPSGDAMMAALLGAWVLDQAPPSWNRGAVWLLGLAIPAAGMCERLSWGFHSAGQVSAGASLGVVLYFWSTRVPQVVLLLEAVVIPPVAFFLLRADPLRSEWAIDAIAHPGGNNNLFSWIVWGLAFQLLSALLIIRHFCALGILGRTTSSGEHLALPSPYFISPPPGHSSSSNPSGGGAWEGLGAARHPLLSASGGGGDDTGCFGANGFRAPSLLPARHFSEETSGSPQPALSDGVFTWVAFLLVSVPLLVLSAPQESPASPEAGLSVLTRASLSRGGSVCPEAGLSVLRRVCLFRGGPLCPEAGLSCGGAHTRPAPQTSHSASLFRVLNLIINVKL